MLWENFWPWETRLLISCENGSQKWTPSCLTLRDNLEATFNEQTKHWTDVYNVVLAVGEMFSNHMTEDPKIKLLDVTEETHGITDGDVQAFSPIDVGAFPENMLCRCLWGATYSAVLFSFLLNLSWHECGNTEYVTYLELMLSFQIYTGIHIPTQLKNEKHKIYQSHSMDARVSRRPSINSSLWVS